MVVVNSTTLACGFYSFGANPMVLKEDRRYHGLWMEKDNGNSDKERYRKLRQLNWGRLWEEEVPRFDMATPGERAANVALIRAVGVVFAENGKASQNAAVRRWLRALLDDPHEKIRRYAMAALPKVGAGREEEKDLLTLLQKTGNDREKKFLTDALDKIAGEQTLAVEGGIPPQTEQKALASVARAQNPGVIQKHQLLHDFRGLKIHFRTRRGLEPFVVEEVQANPKLRVIEQTGGLVIAEPTGPFTVSDLYTARCFGTVGLAPSGEAATLEESARIMTSPATLQMLRAFTKGTIRYRIDFVSKGHQRGAIKQLANLVFAQCPEILNDPREAIWSVDIHSTKRGDLLELRPRLKPDPRFDYRVKDIPAASHPPLAACMARLADLQNDETVWDPFCGAGAELIECALLGRVKKLHGTDLSGEALVAAKTNLAAAGVDPLIAEFVRCDFRDYKKHTNIRHGSVSLMISNPPLGMRIPIPNLRELLIDLFETAAVVLKPGGRLVFINPIKSPTLSHPALRRDYHRAVDMSGFDCGLEKFVKL